MTVEDLSNRSIEGGRSPSPCHHDSAPQSVIFNCGASFSCLGNPKTAEQMSLLVAFEMCGLICSTTKVCLNFR
jgi:hypothetical protein